MNIEFIEKTEHEGKIYYIYEVDGYEFFLIDDDGSYSLSSNFGYPAPNISEIQQTLINDHIKYQHL